MSANSSVGGTLFLGVDPGVHKTAIAVVSEEGPLYIDSFSLNLTRESEEARDEARMEKFYARLDAARNKFDVIHFALEQSDWHQPIGMNYRRERLTQASMAMFRQMLIGYKQIVQMRDGKEISIHFIGANKWKLQYGSATKEGVANLCHVHWPDRVLWDRDSNEYYWHTDGHRLANDETDAIAIAVTALDSFLRPELERFSPRVRGRR